MLSFRSINNHACLTQGLYACLGLFFLLSHLPGAEIASVCHRTQLSFGSLMKKKTKTGTHTQVMVLISLQIRSECTVLI